MPTQTLALALQHQALEFDAAMLIPATLEDDEAVGGVAGPGLDDEVAEVRKAQGAFVLGTLPGRDERQVALIGLDIGDEVEVGQHRRPQPQRRHWTSTCMLRS